jgi:hypothetical protein
MEQRLTDFRQATAPIKDNAIIESGKMLVRTLLDAATALREGIHNFDKAITETADSHADYAIFASFPGAGSTFAPRLLAAFGSRRDRYSSAGQLQTFSGIAPVMEASGNRRWIHFRFSCPKFLRQTFHEYAALSIPFCDWAKQFYERQKNEGKTHHAAVRALAFKWIRILFRCWQSRQTYQEQLYLAARNGRAVPMSRNNTTQQAACEPSTTTGGKRRNHGMKKVGDVLKSILAEA